MIRLLALALLALGLVVASPAAAQNPARPSLPTDLDGSFVTANTIVHHRTSGPDAVTPAAAAAVADAVERAYARFTELGFPRPLDDGDGKFDVYYFNYAEANKHGYAQSDSGSGNTRSGYIALNTAYSKPLETVKHELFHLVQIAVNLRYREGWFSESTASWARWEVDEPPVENFKYFEDYVYPLNCVEGAGGLCQGFGGGYTSWLFFSIFDASFVEDILDRTAALGVADKLDHGFDALLAELAERGQTLQGAFTDLGTRMIQGTLPDANSRGQLPATELAVTPPANGSGSPATAVTSNHASMAFVAIEPSGPCAAVPLALEVQGQDGVAGVSFVQRGGAVTALGLGRTVVAWNACASNPAYVLLANGTANADGQGFTVAGQVLTPALTGLKVAATTRRKARKPFKVPVKVTSSAPGSLRVGLPGAKATTVVLKQGANALAVKVPKSFKAKKSTLTLTPSVGGYTGAKVTRKLRFKTR